MSCDHDILNVTVQEFFSDGREVRRLTPILFSTEFIISIPTNVQYFLD